MDGGRLLLPATCFSSVDIVCLPFLLPSDKIALMVVEETLVFLKKLTLGEKKNEPYTKIFFRKKKFNLLNTSLSRKYMSQNLSYICNMNRKPSVLRPLKPK